MTAFDSAWLVLKRALPPGEHLVPLRSLSHLLAPPMGYEDPDEMDWLIDSLRTHGWEGSDPLLLSEDGRVVDGRHRLYAAFQALPPEEIIPVLVEGGQ